MRLEFNGFPVDDSEPAIVFYQIAYKLARQLLVNMRYFENCIDNL
jgi:hypothetical protein